MTVLEKLTPPRQRSRPDPVGWSIRDRFCRADEAIEGRWAAHRKQRKLDPYGKIVVVSTADIQSGLCAEWLEAG